MNNFKALRTSLGYSQKEFADILYVNQTAVSQWERGVTTPSSAILLRMCELFHTTTDYLLGRTDDPTPPNTKKAPSEITTEEALLIAIRDMLGRDPTDEELKQFLDMGKVLFKIKD